MSTPPSLAPQVHLHELCLLVYGFLRRHSATFPAAFAAFRGESEAFRNGVAAGGKVKTLESVMNEFLELKHSRQVRQSFVSAHASAILEPRMHATLTSIADLLDDYRLLRESPRVPVSRDLFENEYQDMRESPHIAQGQAALDPGGAPSGSNPSSSSSCSSAPSSSSSSSSPPSFSSIASTGREFPRNASSSSSSSSSAIGYDAQSHSSRRILPANAGSPAGGGRRKKKPPRRRTQTGTSMVLGKRNIEDVTMDPRSHSGMSVDANASGVGSYDVDLLSMNGVVGADDGSGDAMHMSLNNLDMRSFLKDPNLPDMLATQINRMSQSSSSSSSYCDLPGEQSNRLVAAAAGASDKSRNRSPSCQSHASHPSHQSPARANDAVNNNYSKAETSPRRSSPRRKRLRSADKSSLTSVISALNEDPKFANIVASSAVGSGGSPSRREIEGRAGSANAGTGDQVRAGDDRGGDCRDEAGAPSTEPDRVKMLVGNADLEGFLSKLHKGGGGESENASDDESSASSSGSNSSDSDSEEG